MRDNKGFTLIELLIVVVIIGILAAIAIPKFSATRERAFVSAMKSDLKNLASQQEIFYSDPVNNYTYATDLASLEATLSDGVQLASITGTATGWSASVTHDGLPAAVNCAVFYGDAAPVAPAVAGQAGSIQCVPLP